jgi:hypothetical protein
LKRLSSLLFVSALSFVSTVSAATVWTSNLPNVADAFAATGSIGNFTVIAGNVDLLTTSGPYTAGLCSVAPCIDLDGTPGQGAIQGVVNFATPGVYTISYYLFNAQRGATASTTVSFGGLIPTVTYTDNAVVNGTPNGLVTQTFNVGAGGNYNLTFTSNNGDYYGDLVADVTVSSVSAIPEPSTMLLFSLPLLAFGSKAFRRSRA